MEIKITCDTKDYKRLDELSNFQGELKVINDANLDKLKKRIIKSGINVPFFIWKDNDTNWILDGHQRKKAIESLIEDGYSVPDKVPIVYLEASDIKDAKEKLLSISSQYGDFTIDGIDNFLLSSEMDLSAFSDIRILDTELVYPPDGVFKIDSDRDIEEEYVEPDKKMLECPQCGHKDSAERFKSVKEE